jgi:molybdopterin/thiamine biosynthesis adenylyltransferase/rhodanese-related sulfurtransferase
VKLDPLVAPSQTPLTREEILRYQRHLSLAGFGEQAQLRMKAARALVIGAGGLGTPVLQYLAAAGIGTLGVVDDDLVDTSNLHRQLIHGVDDVGRPKVDSAREAIARINPFVEVIRHGVRLTEDNACERLAGYDLVLDGADNFATRYLVADAAEITGKPVVWGSILRFNGQVAVFWSGHGPAYRDLYPEPPAPGSVPSCAEGGVLGVLPGLIGTVMATEAIKLITGTGDVMLGRMLLVDALTGTFRSLSVTPDPDRVPVTQVTPVAAFCAVEDGQGSADEVDPPGLRELLALRAQGLADLAVVDVREDWERALYAIDGSLHVPLDRITTQGYDALPPPARGRDLVLYCKAGSRSARALAALRPAYASREERVTHLAGGMDAWLADGGNTSNGETCDGAPLSTSRSTSA